MGEELFTSSKAVACVRSCDLTPEAPGPPVRELWAVILWPHPALLSQVLGFACLRFPPFRGPLLPHLVQPALWMNHLFLLVSSSSCPLFCPQTSVGIHSSEWVHSLQFLFAQGPGELGKVEESSALSSLPTLGSLLLVPAER